MPVDAEKLYLESARKLRSSLPKFAIFLGMAYTIWLLSTTFILPMNNGKFLKNIEVPKLENFIVLSSISVLLFFSLIEGKRSAEALAGLIAVYLVHKEGSVEDIRIARIKRPISNIFYIISMSVAFLMFGGVMQQINPLINQMVGVGLGIWVVISLILIAMAIGIEIEESARIFAESLEKRIRRIKRKSK